MASLEGGIGAVATAVGPGGGVPHRSPRWPAPATTSSPRASLYGGTVTQLDVTLRRFGVDTTFVRGAATRPTYAAAVTDRTKCVFAEVVANPSRRGRRPRGARRRGARRRRPARRRRHAGHAVPVPADRARRRHRLHSATKFLGGHGTTLGGVVVEAGRFDWGNGKLPAHDRARRRPTAACAGGTTSASTASSPSCASSSCATSAPRSRRSARSCCCRASRRCRSGWTQHVANAQRGRPSGWTRDPRVAWVRFAGLPAPPAPRAGAAVPAARARASVFSFGVRGGRGGRAARSSSRCELCSHLANIGDARTLVIHPASTTHQQLGRRAARGRRRVGRPGPHLGRARGRRRHPLGPRPGARPRRQGGAVMSVAHVGAHRGTRRRREPSRRRLHPAPHAHGRRSSGASDNPARASYFVATYLLSSTPTTRSGSSTRGRTRSSAGRSTRRWPTCPGAPDLVDVFRRPATCPASLDEAIAAGARTFWLQLGLWRRGRRARRRTTPGSTS